MNKFLKKGIMTAVLSCLILLSSQYGSNTVGAEDRGPLVTFNENIVGRALATDHAISWNLQLWHYSGGYWSYVNGAPEEARIYDAEMSDLISQGIMQANRLDKFFPKEAELPQTVKDYIAVNGTNKLKVKFTSSMMPSTIIKEAHYKIEDNKIKLQIKPIFNVNADPLVPDDFNISIDLPSALQGYGSNVFSMYNRSGNLLGQAGDTGIALDGNPAHGIAASAVSAGGDIKDASGNIRTGKQIAIGTTANNTLYNSADITIGDGTFANGGSVGIAFSMPIKASFYVQDDDLELTNRWYDGNEYASVGADRNLHAIAKATMSSAAVNAKILFKLENGTVLGEQAYVFNNGTQQQYNFTTTQPAADTKVIACVEATDAGFVDSDPTNNCKDMTLYAAKPNLDVDTIFYSPADIKPGDNVSVTAEVFNEDATAVTTDVTVKVDGVAVGTESITIPATDSVRTPAFTFKAPEATGANVSFTVNPNKNKPANETSWDDNEISRQVPVDLVVPVVTPITSNGDIIIYNQDGSINSATKPAKFGEKVSIKVKVDTVGKYKGGTFNGKAQSFDLYRMYSKYTKMAYSDHIPSGQGTAISIETPSKFNNNTHSKDANEVIPMKVTKMGGESTTYLHKVVENEEAHWHRGSCNDRDENGRCTDRDPGYYTYTYTYDKYYANDNSDDAQVPVEWTSERPYLIDLVNMGGTDTLGGKQIGYEPKYGTIPKLQQGRVRIKYTDKDGVAQTSEQILYIKGTKATVIGSNSKH